MSVSLFRKGIRAAERASQCSSGFECNVARPLTPDVRRWSISHSNSRMDSWATTSSGTRKRPRRISAITGFHLPKPARHLAILSR